MANVKEECDEEFDENGEDLTEDFKSEMKIIKVEKDHKNPPYQPEDNSFCAPIVEEGCSKLDFDYPENIRTLTPDNYLVSKLMPASMSETAEAIVGMTLSKDGESIEIRILMTKEELTDLCSLMNVFHACMAILDMDLCSLTMFKHSPFNLNNTGQNIVCLRNRYSTDLVESEGQMPDPPETTCIPDRTRETHFLSENMAATVPYQQLLNNENLDFRDMASLGVRLKNSEIRPLISVNMTADFTNSMKILGTIFSHWYGHKESFNHLFSQLPCFVSASNRSGLPSTFICYELATRWRFQVF